MGFRNSDYVNPLSLFQSGIEPIAWSNERLHQRLREGTGRPIQHVQELETAYDDLQDEPLLRLEYDRFLPEIKQRPSD